MTLASQELRRLDPKEVLIPEMQLRKQSPSRAGRLILRPYRGRVDV